MSISFLSFLSFLYRKKKKKKKKKKKSIPMQAQPWAHASTPLSLPRAFL